ncbi:hypothetical protein GDO86_009759 [Hymenochirus boettgeri]|nr:hypothetical protein GDO86_009759 [Hymenochirus boettgeri]
MEKSPNSRKTTRRKRSIKSQSSQNEEKKMENSSIKQQSPDHTFNFEDVTQNIVTSESQVKCVPLSPETSNPLSVIQDVKAGTNHKLLPKGESDKSKQQHPASNPMRKKKENLSGSVPVSPTVRKVQGKDCVFKSIAETPAKLSEGNHPIPVSTTKDTYVESAPVLEYYAESGGEDCVTVSCESTGECTSLDAGALSKDTRRQNNNTNGEQTPLTLANSPQSSFESEITPLKSSFTDSRSTVTTKIKITPKPKNVELPMKSKSTDSTEGEKEPITGQPIHRGNTANKISLFENKKTSQKQVDFYATKSISQPKKYIERAKLNIGKNTKGGYQKDTSSSKRNTELKSPDASKSVNVSTEIKKKACQTEHANNIVELTEKQRTENRLLDQMQVEEKGRILDTVVALTATAKESNGQLNLKNISEVCLISEDASVPINNTGTTNVNALDSELKFHKNLGNSSASSKGKCEIIEQNNDTFLAQHCISVTSENEDSPLTNTIPSSTDNIHINGSKEETVDKKETPTTHLALCNEKSEIHTGTSGAKVEKSNQDEIKISAGIQNSLLIPAEPIQSGSEKTNQPEENNYSFEQTNLWISQNIHSDLLHSKPLSEAVCAASHQENNDPSKVKNMQMLINEKMLINDVVESASYSHPLSDSESNCTPFNTTSIVEIIHSPDGTSSGPDKKGNVDSSVLSQLTYNVRQIGCAKDMQHVENNNETEQIETSVINLLPETNRDVCEFPCIESEFIGPDGLRVKKQHKDNTEGMIEVQKKLESTAVQKETNVPILQSQTTEQIQKYDFGSVASDDNIRQLLHSPDTRQGENQKTAVKLIVNNNILQSETIKEVVSESQNTESDLNMQDAFLNVAQTPENVDNIEKHVIPLSKEDGKNSGYIAELENTSITKAPCSNNTISISGVSEKTLDLLVCSSDKNDTEGVIETEKLSLHSLVADEEQPKVLQKSKEAVLTGSVASDDSILDSSSDMEKFAETIRKLESPITLPQKRKKTRTPKSPGPYYGLPPIHEDFLEKILDNDAFPFGLGKKERTKELAPLSLFKMQSRETAEKLRPKRASAEQSMLLKSLKSTKEPSSSPQETYKHENTDASDFVVKRSRIESMYASSKAPFTFKPENVFSPSATTVNTITTSFTAAKKDFSPSGESPDFRTASLNENQKKEINLHENVNEFLALKSQDNFQVDISKLLFPNKENMETNVVTQLIPHNSQKKISTEMDPSSPDGKGILTAPIESTPKSDFLNSISLSKDLPEVFYFRGVDRDPVFSNIASLALPKGVEKINPRPGKIAIFSEANFAGTMFEVYTDLPDCTSWELSATICIRTVRGCWILYEHPNFEGRSIALEEGDLELTNTWGEDSQTDETLPGTVIGSLRLVVKDYRICQIDLFTDPEGLGIMTSYYDDTEELQVYGRLQRTCSIKVHWGVWLIYEEPGFQGVPFIIEAGEYPDLSFLNTNEVYIGSLRPMKMGSRKVEMPYEPKIIIFEKALFEGRQVEIEKEVLKLEALESPEVNQDKEIVPFTNIGSIRVISGLWIGFEKSGFEGHQYLLEEGDYEEWNQWGGFDALLQSLRPVLSDFSTPHMTMFSEKDFDEKAPNINVLGIISNMDETGYGVKTQSIIVQSGVWVAYETPDFTGEQYILEKGMYSHFGTWGAKDCRISSVQPILLDTVENPRGNFKVVLFSEPDFKGSTRVCEEDTCNIEDSFVTKSCKVISGRWAAYEREDFTGNLCVLEEGNYPSLCAMGCQQNTDIRSLQIINYEFSEPIIVLYGKENFHGRKVRLTTETTSLQALGYSPDLLSVEVLGGIWILYEYSNYRGRQIILSPRKIAQWHKFSEWNIIGSLRPLQQKRLYFKLRNKESGMFLSTNGNLTDIKLLRIQVMEETGAEDQIWVYQEGLIRCRVAEDCSLSTAGSLITAGSKLNLSLEQTGTSMHWNINPDGRIYNRSKPTLVLDIKGGNQYDQQHVILNPVTEEKRSQLWEMCIL